VAVAQRHYHAALDHGRELLLDLLSVRYVHYAPFTSLSTFGEVVAK
jgi:hypothetical protein